MINDFKLAALSQVFKPVERSRWAISWPLFICSVILLTAVVAVAPTVSKANGNAKNSAAEESSSIDVNNFGKVTDFFYRGAQPKGDEYEQLAAKGIKTIVDLRDDPKDYATVLAARAGLKYINFPMSDRSYPAADTAAKFLAIVNNRDNWPVFVHCAGGRHRTGAMTAVYRMTMEGWDVNRAYEEMKDYDFYTRWGHKAIKEYVFNYYRDLLNNKSQVVSARPRQVTLPTR